MAANSTYINGDSGTVSAPAALKIIIVGGGIGGFTAAITLRQQGHDVEVSQTHHYLPQAHLITSQ
jgi:succinate dehydrogenase/fumarate reductase flavoprotein subunit